MRYCWLSSGFRVKVGKYNTYSNVIQGIGSCLLCQKYRIIRLKIMILRNTHEQMYEKFWKVHIQFSTTTLPKTQGTPLTNIHEVCRQIFYYLTTSSKLPPWND